MKESNNEFPLLPALGLYPSDIRGDGNCLFNALSDQLYGTQDQHHVIRARVISHMQEHAEYYKQFLEVFPGGGIRRNPKRKNAGTFSTAQYATAPTAEEVDRVFFDHLNRMAKGGTWGDNMEIVAFSSTFGADVKIYQRDQAYMISAAAKVNIDKRTCHIAYHEWEHYSSIRNIDGPHHGLPGVKMEALSTEEQLQERNSLESSTTIAAWQIDIVQKSLPYVVDRATIVQTLEKYHGNVNNAVDSLIDAQDGHSFSSNQSSSVERDGDSSDDPHTGSNKKQDRRLSRATKSAVKHREERKRRERLAAYGESLESLINATSTLPVRSVKNRDSQDGDDTEDEDWRPDGVEPLKDGDTSSGSEYSAQAPNTIKLKLTKSDPATQTAPNLQSRHVAPPKRLVSARELKIAKKLAQKQHAKERKQAAGIPKSNPLSSQPMVQASSNPTMVNAMRTVYI